MWDLFTSSDSYTPSPSSLEPYKSNILQDWNDKRLNVQAVSALIVVPMKSLIWLVFIVILEISGSPPNRVIGHSCKADLLTKIGSVFYFNVNNVRRCLPFKHMAQMKLLIRVHFNPFHSDGLSHTC